MALTYWKLTTRSGLKLSVRTAVPGDESLLDELFHHVRQEELRFRFLGGMKEVSSKRILEMTHIDHRTVETFIALLDDAQTAIAVGTLATDVAGERGEVAISVRADYRNVGAGWELLKFMAEQAKARGMKMIQSVESRDNHDAIELERNMGFTSEPFPDDATLVIVSKSLT
jgi:GNAT superfamily N-acetyltransferase